jgi:AraC-like DNA-binding protein
MTARGAGDETNDPRTADGRHRLGRENAAEPSDRRVPNAMTAHRAHEAARMRAKLTDPAKAYAELVEGLNWAHVRAGKPSLGSLSSQVDYSKATLSKVFTGKAMPSWVLVQRLGRYLNVPPGVVQGWYTMWTAANLSRRRADPAATGTGTVKTGYPCPKCGSWVVDTARHHGWHSEMESSGPQPPGLTRIGRAGQRA